MKKTITIRLNKKNSRRLARLKSAHRGTHFRRLLTVALNDALESAERDPDYARAWAHDR